MKRKSYVGFYYFKELNALCSETIFFLGWGGKVTLFHVGNETSERVKQDLSEDLFNLRAANNNFNLVRPGNVKRLLKANQLKSMAK